METTTSDPLLAELHDASNTDQTGALDKGSITPPTDKQASCGGQGTFEILKVVQVLEENGIPCCLVGTSALIYYGANRARGDWNIGVRTHQLLDAASLLRSHPHTNYYITAPPYAIQPKSLAHTYPRFKHIGVNIFFQLFPSKDYHFDCEPFNFVRSQKGLPYPKLNIFIQSLIDTHDMVALCDIVDGTDVSEDWGKKNLDLSGTSDVDWIKWKNDAIRAQEKGLWSIFCLVETKVTSRRKTWEDAVRGKERRLGFKYSKELFATRFRLRGTKDPWSSDRDAA